MTAIQAVQWLFLAHDKLAKSERLQFTVEKLAEFKEDEIEGACKYLENCELVGRPMWMVIRDRIRASRPESREKHTCGSCINGWQYVEIAERKWVQPCGCGVGKTLSAGQKYAADYRDDVRVLVQMGHSLILQPWFASDIRQIQAKNRQGQAGPDIKFDDWKSENKTADGYFKLVSRATSLLNPRTTPAYLDFITQVNAQFQNSDDKAKMAAAVMGVR